MGISRCTHPFAVAPVTTAGPRPAGRTRHTGRHLTRVTAGPRGLRPGWFFSVR